MIYFFLREIINDFFGVLMMAVSDFKLYIFIMQTSDSNSFQVKLLLGMLVTKCGLEAVKAVLPEEHMKLLSNIRKVC